MTNFNSMPYNHLDNVEKQIPLPIRLASLTQIRLDTQNLHSKIISVTSGTGRNFVLKLLTDSDHLALFFSNNWKIVDAEVSVDAEIIALKNNAEFYNLPSSLNGSRWFCKMSRQVLMVGNEFYGNLKITVRGLCSELTSSEGMFIHGCALSVLGRGVILSGMSGAGKTTLTSFLLNRFKEGIKIVNDDWGGLSLGSGTFRFTQEQKLHMKYPSVKCLIPTLNISPETHLSENYLGNSSDAKARLLISPEEVFTSKNITDTEILSLFIIVTRFQDEPVSMKRITLSDLSVFEREQYSSFYKRSEQFLNGSLFLCDKEQVMRAKKLHKSLVNNFECYVFNNSGEITKSAELILDKLNNSLL